MAGMGTSIQPHGLQRERVGLPDPLLSGLSAFVRSRFGLYYPREKWKDLERQVRNAAPDLGFENVQSCAEWLLQTHPSRAQMDTLVGYLTIGETFFFRDKALFQTLADQILPDQFRSGQDRARRLRIWSAGCCTGEEPYSLAMLLDQMSGRWKGWSIEILATDINPRFLERARKGVYTRWSLRDTPQALIDPYFKQVDANRFEIISRIKDMVQFLPFNLAAPGAGGGPASQKPFEMIFCRNVLLYLSPEVIDRVVARLAGALVDEGWLIVSPTETAFVHSPDLTGVHFPGTILHRKSHERKKNASPRTALPLLIPKKPKTPDPPSPFPLPLPFALSDAGPRASPQGQGPILLQEYSERHSPPEESFPTPDTAKNEEYQRAVSLCEKGQNEEASKILEGLLADGLQGKEASLGADVRLVLARCLANLGRLSEARKWCEQAVDYARMRPESHYLLATIYRESGMEQESLQALKRVIYLDPRFVMAYVALADLARLKGNGGESARHLATALALLREMDPKETVPHSEGLNARGLLEILETMVKG